MPATKTRRKSTRRRKAHGKKTIAPKTLKAARRGGKFPLPLAEKKLKGLYSYVKKRGGKLPD